MSIKYLPLLAIFIAPQGIAQSFTTAAEVRPILEATQGGWVAVREYDGQDLLYITHLLAWRCGLQSISVAINGGPQEAWEIEPCYEAEPTPNAIKSETLLPYKRYDLSSIQTISVQLTYDDGVLAEAQFERANVMTP
ncbi:MAG: hypothetical protein ABJO67_19800 [Pseudoruegeria sp.]